MAGLGETCSHITALLFYMQLRLEVEKAKSCTAVSNKWLPAHKRKVVPSPIAEMNFSSAQMRRCQLNVGNFKHGAASAKRQGAPANY